MSAGIDSWREKNAAEFTLNLFFLPPFLHSVLLFDSRLGCFLSVHPLRPLLHSLHPARNYNRSSAEVGECCSEDRCKIATFTRAVRAKLTGRAAQIEDVGASSPSVSGCFRSADGNRRTKLIAIKLVSLF